ncbi:hypothetical protein HaLaN_10789 [Haematococcus lacustris]|uniref:Uncharacterized protein n=1 Tax=Haematococcus lacustris TaxID=44745 RepID=A0A699YZM3_HAELA|nr:hypothetical protein HaLaN_10789 [Haematococcus lacustris]
MFYFLKTAIYQIFSPIGQAVSAEDSAEVSAEDSQDLTSSYGRVIKCNGCQRTDSAQCDSGQYKKAPFASLRSLTRRRRNCCQRRVLAGCNPSFRTGVAKCSTITQVHKMGRCGVGSHQGCDQGCYNLFVVAE